MPIVICVFAFADLLNFSWLQSFLEDNNDSLKNIHAFSYIYLTSVIIGITWFNFPRIRKTNHADFLMRIEDRFGCDKILEAREIIHFLYREAERKIDRPEDPKEEEKDKYRVKKIAYVSEKLLDIRRSPVKAKDFISLLNFLDFLESISYYRKKNYIEENDMKEMFGGQISYFYLCFYGWIKKSRETYDVDGGLYSELRELAEPLNLALVSQFEEVCGEASVAEKPQGGGRQS